MNRIDLWRLQELLRMYRTHGVMLAVKASRLGGWFVECRTLAVFQGAL